MARIVRPEGKTLSTLDTLENTPNPEAAESALEHTHEGHDHDHDHAGHSHEGHDHEGHQHGPVLNPDCTRELVLDVPEAEVA